MTALKCLFDTSTHTPQLRVSIWEGVLALGLGKYYWWYEYKWARMCLTIIGNGSVSSETVMFQHSVHKCLLVFGTLQRLVACEFQGSDWTSDKQISRTFLGFFKDKLQFSRTKIYLINWHSFTSPPPPPQTLLITLLRLKHVMESFTTFTSSSIVLTFFYTTFRNKTSQNDWVWLAIASEVQK